METIRINTVRKSVKNRLVKSTVLFLSMFLLLFSVPQMASAHCDSYDGPVIKDALRALKENKVELVLKWIDKEHEPEIKDLFAKTEALKNTDKGIYTLVEKHFLETLVRLHREGEGAPFTGLKPLGSTTAIVQMADNSLLKSDVNSLIKDLSSHIELVIKEKYEKAAELSKVKDESAEKGRAYVEAYVDYTHTLEGIEAVLSHGGAH